MLQRHSVNVSGLALQLHPQHVDGEEARGPFHNGTTHTTPSGSTSQRSRPETANCHIVLPSRSTTCRSAVPSIMNSPTSSPSAWPTNSLSSRGRPLPSLASRRCTASGPAGGEPVRRRAACGRRRATQRGGPRQRRRRKAGQARPEPHRRPPSSRRTKTWANVHRSNRRAPRRSRPDPATHESATPDQTTRRGPQPACSPCRRASRPAGPRPWRAPPRTNPTLQRCAPPLDASGAAQ